MDKSNGGQTCSRTAGAKKRLSETAKLNGPRKLNKKKTWTDATGSKKRSEGLLEARRGKLTKPVKEAEEAPRRGERKLTRCQTAGKARVLLPVLRQSVCNDGAGIAENR